MVESAKMGMNMKRQLISEQEKNGEKVAHIVQIKKLLPGFNDLKTVCPEVAVEWHPFRNGNFRPEDVFASCGKKVWWICSKGHEYQQSLNARVKKVKEKVVVQFVLERGEKKELMILKVCIQRLP